MKKGLAFLWHPPEGGYAGGFIASRRFFELQGRFCFTIIDSDATDLNSLPGRALVLRIYERWIRAPLPALFAPLRIVNWTYHALACIALGLARGRDADFIFVPTSEIPWVTLPAAITAAIFSKPLVLCNLNVKGQFGWSFNRVLHRRADGILTISRALAADIRRDVPSVPIAIFPIGTDDESVERSENPAFDAIFVGRHVRSKGIFDLLAIWSRCCRARPTLRLAMVGPCVPSVLASVKRQVTSLGLDKNVSVLGPVTELQKWRLYADSRVCLFPSYIEGWGIVPLEAHMAGLPVVAYALAAYDEHIAASPSATLVALGDIERFADATLAYLSSPPDAAMTASWAKPFTWEAAVAREEEALSEALPR